MRLRQKDVYKYEYNIYKTSKPTIEISLINQPSMNKIYEYQINSNWMSDK